MSSPNDAPVTKDEFLVGQKFQNEWILKGREDVKKIQESVASIQESVNNISTKLGNFVFDGSGNLYYTADVATLPNALNGNGWTTTTNLYNLNGDTIGTVLPTGGTAPALTGS